MKPLTNKTVFDGMTGRTYHRNGEECYTSSDRRCLLHYRCGPPGGNHALLNCQLYSRARSWTGDWHRRINAPFLAVTLVHSGEVHVRSGKTFYTAEAGDVFLLHPFQDYEYATPKHCDKSAVLLGGVLLSPLLTESGLAEKQVLSEIAPEQIERMFEKLNGAMANIQTTNTAIRKCSELCFTLLQMLSLPEKISAYPHGLKKILEEINRNYGNELSINELSERSGISPSGMTRLFKTHLNTTPHQYLIQKRMDEAFRLLSLHLFSVKEIAQKTGYSNPLNFSTEFKKIYGKSPRNLFT